MNDALNRIHNEIDRSEPMTIRESLGASEVRMIWFLQGLACVFNDPTLCKVLASWAELGNRIINEIDNSHHRRA